MTFATEHAAIRNRVNTQWSAAPVAWPNVEYTPTPGTPYVRLTIRNGTSLQPFLGAASRRRSAGVVVAEIFGVSAVGPGATITLADTWSALWRNVQISGITFGEPSAREAVVQEEPWYRWIVETPYYRDWTPA